MHINCYTFLLFCLFDIHISTKFPYSVIITTGTYVNNCLNVEEREITICITCICFADIINPC